MNTTYHIHFKGIVQGVGFRPFVYKSALQFQLKGWVNNTNDGVHICFNATNTVAKNFYGFLLDNLPPLSVVTGHKLEKVKNEKFNDFKIIESDDHIKPQLLITPDVSLCEDCRKELYDPSNRRYQYPFITCTNCGPRYSIITALPYDRHNTTMEKFKMCDICLEEYNNPLERRHFSQTNSCPDCSIKMQLYENGKITYDFDDLNKITEFWRQGKIIAIKGIGGYLLTCDATNEHAIQTLRRRKKRPGKPFAVMYPDIREINKDCIIDDAEIKELHSNHAPIVLLRLRKQHKTGIAGQQINNGLNRLGVMLPYTPLYDLLLQKFKKPVIATSGNITNSTIIYQDSVALKELSSIADIILMNNRDIVIPQDDGVVLFSASNKHKTVIRRSRGKAPVYINPEIKINNKCILATGSMLKSVFGFTHQNNIYISQYLGNTETYEAQENYETTFEHLSGILKPDFDLIVTDKHPGYFATNFGKTISKKHNIKRIEVQHHKAHFLSVLGENNLLESSNKILGVIWDGTGLGDDGNIWGGEFFVYENHQISRIKHIGEFDFILADKMVREPRISALAICRNFPDANDLLQQKFNPTEWNVYQNLLKNTKLKSTSTGRLFDAVASLLYGYDIQTYEAEAGMKLEKHATDFLEKHSTKSYLQNHDIPEHFVSFITGEILKDIKRNTGKDEIAAKFHLTLTDYIRKVSDYFKIDNIAFSGGVFQNSLLTDLLIDGCPEGKNLYFQKEFSPNDEGIPFGQLIYGLQNYKNSI